MKLKDKAKKRIGYQRHLTLSGKPTADSVLFHVIEGAKMIKEEQPALLRKLFSEIEHGDDEHRQWLKDKIEDFISREC